MSLTTKQARELWVKALRSGKYKQGRGDLRRTVNGEDFYCCLGVACDLYTKRVSKRNNWVSLGYDNKFVIFNDRTSLPVRVMKWLGLNAKSGMLIDSKVDDFFGRSPDKIPRWAGCRIYSLIGANDSNDNLSFEKIADMIEKGLVKTVDS